MMKFEFQIFISLQFLQQGIRSYAYKEAPTWILYSEHYSLFFIQLLVAILSFPFNLKFIFRFIPLRSGNTFIISGLFVSGLCFMFITEHVLFIPLLFSSLISMAINDVSVDQLMHDYNSNPTTEKTMNMFSIQNCACVFLSIGNIIGHVLAASIVGYNGSETRLLFYMVYSITALVSLIPLVFIPNNHIAKESLSLKQTTYALYKALTNRQILYPLSWVFLSTALLPDISPILSIWKLENMNIGANIQTIIEFGGELFAFVLLLIFSRHRQKTISSFRYVFLLCQFGLILVYLTDVIVLNFWHKDLLPDIIILIISSIIFASIKLLFSIAFLILSTRLSRSYQHSSIIFGFLLFIGGIGKSMSSLFASLFVHFEINLVYICYFQFTMAAFACFFIGLVPHQIDEIDFTFKQKGLENV